MSKLRLFLDNFFIYGLGGIISKIIPLVMVPIITRIMPDTKYFGISDMNQTIVSFGSALAVVGMYDAMYRMFFEDDDDLYKRTVCSTTLIFTIVTSISVFIIMIFCKSILAKWFLGTSQLEYVIYFAALATLVGSTNSIIAAPTRMQNKRKIYLITNTITPLVSYGISIPLLLKGHYIIALPLAGVLSGITLELSFLIINHRWFSIRLFNDKLLIQLLKIAIPLLPNFLIYWIFNSSDRLMIVNILDAGWEGIYSVGSKLGHASQLIYTAFAGGWQFFAFSTMKEKSQVESNSKVFEYLGVVSFVATSVICTFSYALFVFLFPHDYISGYIIAPYLFLSPLLQMLFQVAANQFLVVKKTWPNMFILLGGALANVVLNLLLIPLVGIEGAAISTLIGYVLSLLIAVIVLYNMRLMIISRRFIISTIGMISYFLVWRFLASDNIFVGIPLLLLYIIFLFLLYYKDIYTVFKKH